MAAVLGRAEDGDGVGGLGLILSGDAGDLVDDVKRPYERDDEDQRDEAAEEIAKEVRAGVSCGSAVGKPWTARLGEKSHGVKTV